MQNMFSLIFFVAFAAGVRADNECAPLRAEVQQQQAALESLRKEVSQLQEQKIAMNTQLQEVEQGKRQAILQLQEQIAPLEAQLRESEEGKRKEILQMQEQKIAPLEARLQEAEQRTRMEKQQWQEQKTALEKTLQETEQESRKEITQLQEQKIVLESQLQQAAQGKRISLVDFSAQVCGVTSDLASSALESTSADEAILQHLSTVHRVSKDTAINVASRVVEGVTSIDYGAHWHMVKESDVAKTLRQKSAMLHPHVAKLQPIVSQVHTMIQPTMEKVQPVVEACKPYVTQAVNKCTTVLQTAHSFAEENVFSEMHSRSSQVFRSLLAKAVDPVFHHFSKLAPQHEPLFPTDPVDRGLLIFVILICIYNGLYFLQFCLKWCVRILRRSTLLSFGVFRFAVWLPLKVLLKLVGFVWWVATGFYCCGLCSRRKKSNPKSQANGKADGRSIITVEEAVRMLKTAKEKNNINKALKVLAGNVKSGDPMKQPKTVEGKCLTKAVLFDACKKVGVDTKGIDL
jgi:hypothetical protein